MRQVQNLNTIDFKKCITIDFEAMDSSDSNERVVFKLPPSKKYSVDSIHKHHHKSRKDVALRKATSENLAKHLVGAKHKSPMRKRRSPQKERIDGTFMGDILEAGDFGAVKPPHVNKQRSVLTKTTKTSTKSLARQPHCDVKKGSTTAEEYAYSQRSDVARRTNVDETARSDVAQRTHHDETARSDVARRTHDDETARSDVARSTHDNETAEWESKVAVLQKQDREKSIKIAELTERFHEMKTSISKVKRILAQANGVSYSPVVAYMPRKYKFSQVVGLVRALNSS